MSCPAPHSVLVAESESHNPKLACHVARLATWVGSVQTAPVKGAEPMQAVNLTLPFQAQRGHAAGFLLRIPPTYGPPQLPT